MRCQKKAISWNSPRCGLHVHIGREILGATENVRQETLGKMLYLYHHFLKDDALNTRVFGRSTAYNDHTVKSNLAKAVEILGKKVLKKKRMCDEIDSELKSQCSCERYVDINITNSHTIEFRRGRGSLKPERIAGVVMYCELICLYAKSHKWESIGLRSFTTYLKKNVKETDALYTLINE